MTIRFDRIRWLLLVLWAALGPTTSVAVRCIPYDETVRSTLAAETAGAGGEFKVGAYNEIRGTVAGMDAHHVGQQALMKQLVPGYDAATAPSILVPKVGHTIRGPNGILSRSTNGIDSVRDLIARDINELRRVYPDAPNSRLQEPIEMN